jgi:hypothetical protein
MKINRHLLIVMILVAVRTPGGWSEARYVGSVEVVSSSRAGEMCVTDHSRTSNQVVPAQLKNGRFVDYAPLKRGRSNNSRK